jgi:sugar lactone lactonase YvrE
MIARYLYIAVLACMFIVLACENPENPVYGPGNPDPNPGGQNPATLTDISPSTAFLKEVVTITGSGFNPDPEANVVRFGSGVGVVLTATETMLSVELPNLTGVSVKCSVAPRGAEEWSNELDFIFKPAVLTRAEGLNWPMGVEADDDDNIYVGSAEDEAIYKIDVDGNQTEYASVAVSGAIGWGPDGDLFVASSWEGKIFRVSDDGATVEDYIEVGAAIDFDWAENGNMYIVRNYGEGIDMYDGSTVTHVADFGDEMKSCRIVDDYLYVSAIWDGTIYRYPITADGLGEPEGFFEGDSPVGVEADGDGNVLFTLAWEYTIYVADAEGNTSTVFEGELEDPAGSPMRYISYHGKSLYVVHPAWGGDEGSVKQIYLGIDQAPNWGLTP